MRTDDSDFRKIVRTAHDWRDRIQNGSLSDTEAGHFEAWLAEDIRHQEIYEQAEIYWAAFDHFEPSDVYAKYRQRSLGSSRLDALPEANTFFGKSWRGLAAVSIALVAMAAPLILFQLNPKNAAPEQTQPALAKYRAAVGETITVTLSDATIATLGADTQIETEFSAGRRVVRLESGAALFDVARDEKRPFSVASERATVTALGTVFEVRNNGGVTRVAVAEGKVAVTHPVMINGKATSVVVRRELNSGEEIAALEAQGLRSVELVDTKRVGAWRDDMLIYKGATLTEIVADANRYSAKEISLERVGSDIANAEINASFPIDDIDGMIGALPDLYPVVIDAADELHVRIRPSR